MRESGPILDLQAAVADLDLADNIGDLLGGHGWHYVPPELDARQWWRLEPHCQWE